VPERFVVEVGNVRVAVHGTRFSVQRDGDEAFVQVERGVVSVSSVGGGQQTLLEAPAEGRFRLTGDDAGSTVEATGNVSQRQSPRRRPLALQPAEPSERPAEPTQLPKEPTFSDVEAGLAGVEGALRQCLLDTTRTNGKVSVSLKTRVTLRIDQAGLVAGHEFSPPLSPTLEACAQTRFRQVRFTESATGALVIRDLLVEP
jgi:hypothetical protein